MQARLINEIDLDSKKVVIRVDMNVPIKSGMVRSDTRIIAALPTIKYAIEQNAAILILSHLGRPTEGEYNDTFSMKPVAKRLAELLNHEVKFFSTLEEVEMKAGQVGFLDNVRFLKGESKNCPELSAKLASFADVYCMEAFGAAHRAHASTEGALRAAKVACAGFLMACEMNAANALMQNPEKPFYAILGGSKVSTKLTIIENLVDKVDGMIVGGGIANTFLYAAGYNIGRSLYEPELAQVALNIMRTAKYLPLPIDVVVAKEFVEHANTRTCFVDEVEDDEMILDIGPMTVTQYEEALVRCETIVWNGPVGAFETQPFDKGSRALGECIAKLKAYTVACGGDLIAAVEAFKVADKMSYISTGGGAFLEVLEGKTLPSLKALADKS